MEHVKVFSLQHYLINIVFYNANVLYTVLYVSLYNFILITEMLTLSAKTPQHIIPMIVYLSKSVSNLTTGILQLLQVTGS